MRPVLINVALFQIGWFACVLSGAANQPLVGVSIALMIIAFHIARAKDRKKELFLVLSAMLIGACWDSILVWQNWLGYTSGIVVTNTAPYWIVVMWGLFATTLNVSLRWLKNKTIIAAFLGALAGPLAYYGGLQLGAVQFLDTQMALLSIAIGWAIFTPILISLSNNLDGYPSNLTKSTS